MAEFPSALVADVVLPGAALATTEGNSQFVASGGFQFQNVFESSLFPPGGILITGLRLREGAGFSDSSPYTASDFRIDLSTTTKTGTTLEATFDNNHGADRTTVRSGPVSFTFTSGASPGPNDFGSVISFSTPFVYVPSSGRSLLIHILQAFEFGPLMRFDRQTGFSGAGIALSSDSGSSTATFVSAGDSIVYQLVTQSIPESSPLWFGAVVAGVLSSGWCWRWSRGRAQANA